MSFLICQAYDFNFTRVTPLLCCSMKKNDILCISLGWIKYLTYCTDDISVEIKIKFVYFVKRKKNLKINC